MPGLGSQLQNIGTALAGFSAGLQGNLPQFQAVQNQKIQQEQQNTLLQQEQRMKMEEERRKTMFSDAAAALQLTKMGNLDQVVQLGLNRLQGLQQLSQQDPNIDPSDTQRVTQLAIAARNGDEEALELLTAELESTVQVGQAIGVLESPKTEDAVTDLGKIQQDLNAGLISPEQAATERERVGQTSRELLQLVKPDGTIAAVQFDPKTGDFMDERGEPMEIPPGTTLTRLGQPSGAIGDVLPNTEEMKIRNAEGSVRTFNDTAQRVVDLVAANPDINTFAANAAGIASGLLQETGAIARMLGVPRETFDPSSYESTYRDLGIENAAVESLVTSLAFQAAAASNQGGNQVSNRDVQRFITQIGGQYSDPARFMRALSETVNTVNDSYLNRYESLYGKPFEGDLGMPNITTPEASDDEWEIVR